MMQGSYVALVTPFRDGKVDYGALERLVNFHVEQGTDGVVPCGTTGESPTLSMKEHEEVVAATVRFAAGRIHVMAGTGANSTSEAVELTRAAEEAGANSALLVSPYYNKPEPEGMYLHFKTVAESVGIPLVLYNIPSRTGREIALETLVRLSEIKNITGLKAACGSTDRVTEVVRRTKLEVLSGDDSMTLPFMSVGAKGVISVAANIVPTDVR
nr:4-hydroxy-tetrahydrodipicolinate synthase [Candidatus Brocadiia bacterium]